MARNLDPKCKQCRRLGEKLFLKGERCFSPKCAMVKRNYPPGQHGPKGTQRISQFGLQLREKQKAVKNYRILENQFSRYFKSAKRLKGDTGENLIKLLEMRLDNIIFRLKFASSRDMARQLVNHGNVRVNNKKVDVPSHTLKVNDTISIDERYSKTSHFQETLKKITTKDIPKWLMFTDEQKGIAKVVSEPASVDTKQNVDPSLIVEYYSR
jgi:small subunit ribosomal protein S4